MSHCHGSMCHTLTVQCVTDPSYFSVGADGGSAPERLDSILRQGAESAQEEEQSVDRQLLEARQLLQDRQVELQGAFPFIHLLNRCIRVLMTKIFRKISVVSTRRKRS